MTDVILDTLNDVIRLIPFLFLTYLLLEWMEHQTSGKMEKFLERHQKAAPLAGSLFGIIPECGFSSAASSLYATGIISMGTLCAVYLSTSDEMLPVLISSHASASKILPILAVKIIVACIAGYLADFLFQKKKKKMDIGSFCRQEHCECEEGILKPALVHTGKITVWLLAVTFLLNLVTWWIGMDTIRAFVLDHASQSVLMGTLVGMIPSCASSVLLSQLYLDQILPFAAVCAGLLANAGVGMTVLFRVNRNQKENFRIVLYVWAVSLVSGLILQIFA